MKIKIYGIGGNLNDKYVGTAVDHTTVVSLIDLIEYAGGYACSLHGTGLTEDFVSGEYLIHEARAVIQQSIQHSKACSK